MRKIVAIFYPEKYPKKTQEIEKIMKRNFKDFFKYFPDYVDIYYIIDETSYIENDRFLGGFKKIENTWKYQKTKIQADFVIGNIYKYSFKNYFKNPIREVCRDKGVNFALFSKYYPKNYTCENTSELKENFPKIPSKEKVVKPTIGQQWKGVQIVQKFQELHNVTFPCVLQEFVDTSSGIYNFKGIFDYRIVILNGKIIGKVLRRAKKWTLIANVFLGWEVVNVWNYPIPPSIKNMVKHIDSYMEQRYPQRYYSIDFWVDTTGKAYIFEMNSAPAVSTMSIRKHLNQYIVDTFLS